METVLSTQDQDNIKSAFEVYEVYTDKLTRYVSELAKNSDNSKLEELARLRAFDIETLKNQGIFYIGDMTEMLIPKYLGELEEFGVISDTNKKPIFRNRWVMPIHDTSGRILNLVGYNPYADERYIYGTSRFYSRKDTYYGLENLELAYKLGYAFITEGITDTIRLRDIGYLNSFAMCGTHSSEYLIRQLNRCRNGVILIPDRDDAGLRAHKQWKFNRSITIFVNFRYKDVDEMCYIKNEDGTRSKNKNNIDWLKECISECEVWIKSGNRRVGIFENEKVTIV